MLGVAKMEKETHLNGRRGESIRGSSNDILYPVTYVFPGWARRGIESSDTKVHK